MNFDDVHAYKKEIADLYTKRSTTYDNSMWHDRMAKKLVDFVNIKIDSQILDIGTGTGMVAYYAASKIGPEGTVIGIDISEGMIQVANAKLNKSPYKNIRFDVGDGEDLNYSLNSFDVIFCSSAFIWMTDLPATLRYWRKHLKPDGKLGLHAFSETAYITGVAAQSVLQKYGVNYLMSKPTGTVEKCTSLLEKAGYTNININVDPDGVYIDLEEAKNSWVSELHPAPGQYPHPLKNLTPEQLDNARADYEREMEKLSTENGVWNDMTTFYVYGEK